MNILGETFYFKRKPSLKTLIGASIGMIGIIIIFNDEIFNFSFEKGTHIGLFLALIGTFCASTGNMVHQRNLNNNFPRTTNNCLCYVIWFYCYLINYTGAWY